MGVARLAVVAGWEVDRELALEEKDYIEALKRILIFRTLSAEQLRRLSAALQICHVAPGQTVFSQGEAGSDMFIIHEGQLEVLIDGCGVRTLGAGDYVGERALLTDTPRSATVVTVEESELWRMDKDTFQHVIHGRILDQLQERIGLQNTKVEIGDLEILRPVGKGGFGTVLMTWCAGTGVRYALKCMRKEDVVQRKMQESVCRERSILGELEHPFVIKFVRSFNTSVSVYLLMELVTGGELLEALDALGLLSQQQAQFYTGSIVLALEFLHLHRIVYLDLKGENALVDQHGYLKIIDFGIAERVSHGRCYAVKGTPPYMAPEVIRGDGYTTAADFWSLGVCLYEFMVGRLPFGDGAQGHEEIFKAVLKAPLRFPEWLDAPDAKALIRGLLTRDPDKRPGGCCEGFLGLKGHAFFAGFGWDALLGRQLEPPFVPKGEQYSDGGPENDPGSRGSFARRRLLSFVEQETRESSEHGALVWQDPSPGWDAVF